MAADEEFREFMRGRWATMVRLAYGLTGDLGHAEDVAQAAFARVYASWGRVRQAGDPDAYLRQVVVNENRRRFRKQRLAEDLPGTLPDRGVGDAADAADERAALLAVNGRRWSATAYEGPWGTCVVASSGGGGCWADARRSTTGIAIVRPVMIAGSAAPSVASLKVTLADGSSLRVRVVAVGNERLWAMTIGFSQHPKNWVAYDASAKPVGSGRIALATDCHISRHILTPDLEWG